MAHAIEVEIDRNYAVFVGLLESLLPENRGQYALLHDRQLTALYPTAGAAERAGYLLFGDQPYSVQLVSEEPVDLGFYSYAIRSGPARE